MFKKLSWVCCLTATLLWIGGAPVIAATGTVIPTIYPGGEQAKAVVPVSLASDWVAVCTTPTTADNAGSTVVDPIGITRTAQNWATIAGKGTTIQVCLKYPTAGTVSTSPVVQVFGKDSNSIPQRLNDKDGTHELTLTVTAASDVRDGTYSYTNVIEVDANANRSVLVGVKTALAGSSLTGAVILVRVK